MWIVSVGDPFNGLTLYGPFGSEEDAFEWADGSEHTEWTLAQLQSAPGVIDVDKAYNDGYTDAKVYYSPEVAQ